MSVFADVWQYLTDGSNWTGTGGILDYLVQQLLLTATALALAVAIGLPLAMWLGHIGRGGFLAINVSNVGRAIPTFALLALLVTAEWPGIATFGPFGRAGIATLIALTLFALPPIITNTYVAIREVSSEVKEAARGMGMTGWQQFRRVELPLATPLVAGPGLGRIITDGFANSYYGKGIAGAVVVAVVAMVLEVLAVLAQRAIDPVPRGPQHRTDDALPQNALPTTT
jgi:osmoprotectant transport system permease protein